ncbi:STAS domain-containing protein [Actinoplanes sp. NPDC026670]|uniref:STAS domain-containing protein n=1 Tax=Actinoplanes sp. NPDC026670 TaxID=3154700 RepID=UPI0033BFF1CC
MGAVVITVAGEIDASNAAWLREIIKLATTQIIATVEIDLVDVTLLSRSGLEVLIEARDTMDGRFAVIAASSTVRRVLGFMELLGGFGLGHESQS